MAKSSDKFITNQGLLTHILKISRRMAETRMLNPLLNYVIDQAINLVGAEQGYLVLTEPDNSLHFRVMRDHNGNNVENAEDQVSTSVLQEVVSTGQPLVLRNAMNNTRFGQAESVVILRLRSIMCVPLITQGDTVGAIYVENRSVRGRFTEDDLPPLTLFANQAAVAIENASLNELLEARVEARTSELEQTMHYVEKSWTEAVEVNRLRTVWFSQVAHDLRAPLGIACGALSLMYDQTLGPLNEEQIEWVEKSLQAVTHVAQLTETLYDLSKIETGHINLNLEPVDFKKFLEDVQATGKGLPWSPNVQLKLTLPDELPFVYLDPVRIKQVLLNLLSNAQKFTDQGSVTLQAQRLPDGELVQVSVADTGEGISPDQIERIFERFHQADPDSQRKRQGSGLGLAICRELIEMHGGKIWAKSEPGAGSTFFFTLPTTSPDQNAGNRDSPD